MEYPLCIFQLQINSKRRTILNEYDEYVTSLCWDCVTILGLYKTMYENASKIASNNTYYFQTLKSGELARKSQDYFSSRLNWVLTEKLFIFFNFISVNVCTRRIKVLLLLLLLLLIDTPSPTVLLVSSLTRLTWTWVFT